METILSLCHLEKLIKMSLKYNLIGVVSENMGLAKDYPSISLKNMNSTCP